MLGLEPSGPTPQMPLLPCVLRRVVGRGFSGWQGFLPGGLPAAPRELRIFLVLPRPVCTPIPTRFGGQRPEQDSLPGGGPHDPHLSSVSHHPSPAGPWELQARSENGAIDTAVLSHCAGRTRWGTSSRLPDSCPGGEQVSPGLPGPRAPCEGGRGPFLPEPPGLQLARLPQNQLLMRLLQAGVPGECSGCLPAFMGGGGRDRMSLS